MVIRGEPAPVIWAPMALRYSARSWISGSHAADSMTVLPSASVAAIIRLAVPSTVEPNGPPRKISAPLSRLAVATMSPLSSSISAPSARRPIRWRSTGRGPIAHPPGMATRARLRLASSGPSTQMLARIFRTRSYGAWELASSSTQIRTGPSASRETEAPRSRSTSAMYRMSATSGTFASVLTPSLSSAAAMSGRLAFFAPLMRTLPLSLPFPLMTNRSMILFRAPGSGHHGHPYDTAL